MTKLSFQTAISYMHHTTVRTSRLHLQSRYGRCHAVVYASQHLEKAAMDIRNFGRTIRDSIVTTWRRQWMLLRGDSDTTRQEHESGSREILVRRTITQETHPQPTGVNVPFELLHQISLLADEEFTPPGSPTGTTLGIPPEHLLDEDPPETSEHIQPLPLNFDDPFATPQEDSDTLSDGFSTDSTSGEILSNESTQLAPPGTESSTLMGDSPAHAAAGASWEGNPTNGPPGNLNGRYTIINSNLVYICNHCGAGRVVDNPHVGYRSRDDA
ncbi:hypothetical protein GGI35DRAFT_169447 [Trichoderma velutinum]